MFDPSKLNLDIDENNDNKKAEDKAENIEKKQEVKTEKVTPKEIETKEEKVETSSSDEDILGSLEIVTEESPVEKLEKQETKEEKIENSETKEKETENIYTSDKEVEDIVKKEETKEEKIIYDINITKLQDLLFLLSDKEYDFLTIEPNEENVKIIFRKNNTITETKYIRFPIYSNILIQNKTLTKLNLEDSSKTQEGFAETNIKAKSYKVLTKIVPGEFGEKIFLKLNLLEKKVIKKKATKMTPSQIFTFLGTIAAIALLLGGSFIGFIALNAKTVEDVKFFYSLGINLNEINNFISQTITIIFSILLLIESIFLVTFLFKFSLTKKEFKQKKIKFGILAALFLILTFSTFSAWMYIDRKVKSLPNWQELSYGEVQVYDNSKLVSNKFDKEKSLLKETSNLIGPMDIKFDLSYYQKNQESKGFTIKKYIWQFSKDDIVETPISSTIKTFNKKGNNPIKLTIQKTDPQGKLVEEVLQNIPSINISYLVDVNEEVLKSGGKKVSFDASDLEKLGKIEWYLESNLEEPITTGSRYVMSRNIFEETLIGMCIKRDDKESEGFDKIFIISGEEKIEIDAKIKHQISPLNDLEVDFFLENISNKDGNGFIEKYKWIIGDKEYTKAGNLLNPEEASKITHKFEKYGEKEVKVILTDSLGEEKEFKTVVNIQKVLKLKKELIIFNNSEKIENVKYDGAFNEYFINNLGTPTEIKLDARFVKSNDNLYTLKQVRWDYNNDGDFDETSKIGNYEVNKEGNHTINVEYTFQNFKIKEKEITIKEKIYIEGVQKEAIINFAINKQSNYVPTTIGFDASKSIVKNSNIVKFIWSYGDGITEERDAIVPGHKYIKSGTYSVKLKVITEDGREFETTKKLVLNKKPQTIDIKTSMKKAPLYQGIDFSSEESEGQINSYFWDFGDGETSTEANPSHSYSKPGTYTVKLRLDFENKNILEDSIKIEVYEQ